LTEILSQFDVIAIQELFEDLTPLDKVMEILGRNYC